MFNLLYNLHHFEVPGWKVMKLQIKSIIVFMVSCRNCLYDLCCFCSHYSFSNEMRMKTSNWRAPWMKVCVAHQRPHMPSWTMRRMPSHLATKRSVSSLRDVRQHNAKKMMPQIVPFHSVMVAKHWAQILPLEWRIISQRKTGLSWGSKNEVRTQMQCIWVQTYKQTNK